MVVKAKHPVSSCLYFMRLLFLMLGALLWQPTQAAVTPRITLTTESESIFLGDIVVIEIEDVGILGKVDVAALFKGADLLRETTGTRIAVIEGRVVEVNLRRMEFIPRREGTVVFGPLRAESAAGSIVSNSISLEVLPEITEQWQPEEDDLHISVLLSSGLPNEVPDTTDSVYTTYVGQRIIAEIKLHHRHPIEQEHIMLPEFEGFEVLSEYESRRTNETIGTNHNQAMSTGNSASANSESATVTTDDPDNSRQFKVITWRYHLFAQRSGQISIGNVKWTGTARRSRTQRAAFAVESPVRLLQIKPASVQGNWWLPASNLTLSESWSSDARELSAGDETFRTITLNAQDVLVNHLPDIQPLESRAITSTLIEQSRSQKITDNHIISTAIFKFRLVAQSPIPVFLDTVRVAWFDTSQTTLREAIIPARRINVGLPDRADLLTELARGEHWWDKINANIDALASNFAYWQATLLILLVAAAVLLGGEVRLSLQQRSTKLKGRGTSSLPPL